MAKKQFNPVAVQNELLEIATSLKHAQEFLTLIGNSNLVDKAVSWGAVDNCLDGWASIWELNDKINRAKKLFKTIEEYALKNDLSKILSLFFYTVEILDKPTIKLC